MEGNAEEIANGSSAIEPVQENGVSQNGTGDEAQAKDDPRAVAARLTGQLMTNPRVLAAFDEKLRGMIGKNSGYIDTLPKSVKRRLKALKRLQSQMLEVESKFFEEVHSLECKYATLYQPLYDKREAVINARLEPTDSDCDWPSDEEDEESEPSAKIVEIDETKPDSEKTADDAEDKTKGVPEFWLTIFKNVEILADRVQEVDEPILQHLLDIKVSPRPVEDMGFVLEFVFSPNEYFTNTVLTKEYTLDSKPKTDNPLKYMGPEIVSCKGCKIDWKADKDVTVRKQKHKVPETKKMVTQYVKVPSFFNFFSPPEVNGEEDEEAYEKEEELVEDYKLGQLLQDQIIPRAILYFTGEALDDEDDGDDEYEDEDEGNDEGDGENSEDDPDYAPPKGGENGPADCKQQ
jgi:nucleosome assembly protein 1-like 1